MHGLSFGKDINQLGARENRPMFKMKYVNEQFRILHNEKRRHMYTSSNIIMREKYRRLRWAWHVAGI
jgi:phosphorylcholine metabolism protein LicD